MNSIFNPKIQLNAVLLFILAGFCFYTPMVIGQNLNPIFADKAEKTEFTVQNESYATDSHIETAAVYTISPGKSSIIGTPTHKTGKVTFSWQSQPVLTGKVLVLRVGKAFDSDDLSLLEIDYHKGGVLITTPLKIADAFHTNDYYEFVISPYDTQLSHVTLNLKTREERDYFGFTSTVKSNSIKVYGLYYRDPQKPNADLCKYPEKRVYASSFLFQKESFFDPTEFNNGENAVDSNPHTKATLKVLVGALGSNKHVDLSWNHQVEPGTPAYLKFGQLDMDASLLKKTEVAALVGDQVVSDWVNIDHSFLTAFGAGYNDEVSFIPTRGNKKIAVGYDGIRVKLTITAVGAGVSTDIYGAYYYKDTPENEKDCSTLLDVRDITWGASGNSGNSVKNAENAIDGNEDTAASFNSILDGGLSRVEHYIETSFVTPFLKNDILEVIVSDDKNIKLDFWKNIKIQKKMRDENVGHVISEFSFLSLWGGRDKIYVPTDDVYKPFDRVRISTHSAITIASQFYIHEIRRTVDPSKIIDNAVFDGEIGYVLKTPIDCQGGLQLNANAEDGCTTYKWYDENGELIGEGFTVDVPKEYSGSTHTFYLQPTRFECESLGRIGVTFTVTNCGNDCIISNPTLTSYPKG